MYCEPSLQFAFGEDDTEHLFELNGVQCAAALANGSLLVYATGFASQQAATDFFNVLQRHMAALSVKDRVAIAIPSTIKAPEPCFFTFMPDDQRCNAHGWPAVPIKPLAISNLGASWYPEHEYVAIFEATHLVPQFQYSLSQFAHGMQISSDAPLPSEPLAEDLVLAVVAYAQVKRSTQAVWSFLLTVMVLEMLSTETKTSPETRHAIVDLVKEAKAKFKDSPGVDLERIRTCLDGARTESISSALRSLVQKYCCPGIASDPPQGLFVDAADCEKKVAAIYRMRSKYVHEGRVRSNLAYGFAELQSIAMHALGHILTCMLQESKQPPSAG